VPPHVGGHKGKVGGTSKNFRPALRAGIMPPYLQIASDATESIIYVALPFNLRNIFRHYRSEQVKHISARFCNCLKQC